MAKSAAKLSPSDCHYALMKQTPRLHYKNQNLAGWKKSLTTEVKQRLAMPSGPDTKVPLRVKSLWQRQHEYGSIEKIQFTAEKNVDVLAFVCLPKGHQHTKIPFFVCLQGHSTGAHNSIGVHRENNKKTIDVAGDRDFGLYCMKLGIGALCIEQRSFGERREQKQKNASDHGCHDATMHALMLGRTLMGERVFDVDRGLDYLKTRKDVDWKRVGVMGNSGGGTISTFAGAVLPRITHVMPSCYFCTFADSIMSIYHCADNYLPGLMPVAEMSDVLGLAAPKPCVIVAGKTDPIFPINATRKAFRHLKTIYKKAGSADNCKLVVGDGGHRFYADAAWKQMVKFLE